MAFNLKNHQLWKEAEKLYLNEEIFQLIKTNPNGRTSRQGHENSYYNSIAYAQKARWKV